MSGFQWTSKREQAALALSQGDTIAEVAQQIGLNERTIYRWKDNLEFAVEVDRLSCMVDIAGRAHRLRLAMQVIRNLGISTNKDLLDWLKYAQGETDGIKLDLAAIIEATTSVADGGSAGDAEHEHGSGESLAADPE